jgi:hypothetical protein
MGRSAQQKAPSPKRFAHRLAPLIVAQSVHSTVSSECLCLGRSAADCRIRSRFMRLAMLAERPLALRRLGCAADGRIPRPARPGRSRDAQRWGSRRSHRWPRGRSCAPSGGCDTLRRCHRISNRRPDEKTSIDFVMEESKARDYSGYRLYHTFSSKCLIEHAQMSDVLPCQRMPSNEKSPPVPLSAPSSPSELGAMP